MSLYLFLTGLYSAFLALFPAPIQWFVTLLVLIGLIGAFVALIRHNWLFLILLIILLPVLFPVLQHFFADVYAFFLFLLGRLTATAPKG